MSKRSFTESAKNLLLPAVAFLLLAFSVTNPAPARAAGLFPGRPGAVANKAGAGEKGKKASAGQKTGVGNAAGPGFAKKGPIIITSDRLSADSATHTAIFSGRVQAKNNDMWLYADQMTVHYSEEGGVQTIDADGNVKLIREDRVVTSGKAHYTKADDKVVFTINPKIVQATTVVTGTIITYYVSTDKMDVQNSRVFIQGK